MTDRAPGGTRRAGFVRVRLDAVAVVVVLVVAAVVWIRLSAQKSERAGTPSTARNVMVIMIDDATYEEIRVMKNLKTLLGAQGTTFSNFYTTSPNCCPSRGGYYLGQFPHNSGVRDNIPPLGGANSFTPHENESLGVWMQRAGYYTAQIGKYLNGWGSEDKRDNWTGGISPRPGWDHWFVGIDPTTYQYYNFKISDDGKERSWGPKDYQTDITGAEAVSTIKRATDSGKPWFISWTPMSPHVAIKETDLAAGQASDGLLAVAADKYQGTFGSESLPASPSLAFGPAAVTTPDLKGKPTYVTDRVNRYPAKESVMTEAYRTELEALQSVDDWIGTIYHTLEAANQLDNTDIIFWSDNGLFHGEHGLLQKGLLYEEAAHIPLIIRGPGFPAGAIAKQLTLNIDLTPTILAIAQGHAGTPLDGRDLAPVANDSSAARTRAILLEYWYSFTKITTRAVRFNEWAYMEWSTGDIELYDLKADPFEMTNLASDPATSAVRDQLHGRLAKLADCQGATCEDSDLSRR